MATKSSPKGNANLAIGYLRVSTTEQHLGPEAQRQQIQAWATSNGITILAWHEDHGVSGGTDLENRPALVAAIGELRASHAGILVVAKRDRLARDTLVAGLIEKAVKSSGGTVVSADGVANGDDAASAFMRSILDAAAAYERALIRSRTAAAMQVKKARGELVGSVPYGYALAGDKKTLVPHEGEQAVMRIAKELRATGMSLRAIAKELEARGLSSRKGVAWQPPQVQRMVA